MTSFLDGVEYVGAIWLDVALGKLPVATDWDTDPPNLAYITDGNKATETGDGVKAFGAAGAAGNIEIDFGREITGIVLISFDGKVNASQVSPYLKQYNGAAWSTGLKFGRELAAAVYQNIASVSSFVYNAEKIQVYFYAAGALTLTAKYRSISVLEVL